MKYTIILIRLSDKTERTKEFKSKKELQRFLSNNYMTYSWRNV
jgi:hypothetical protein